MKKTIFLAQLALLSSMLCNQQGPIAKEFKQLEEKGGTTAEFIATIDGKAEQVAKELDCIRLILDACKSEGPIDAWSSAQKKLACIAQSTQSRDNSWVLHLAELAQSLPAFSNPDSNIHGNMQIMFETGKKPTRTAPPSNACACEPDKARYITLELELIPVRADQAHSATWSKTVARIIEVIKKISDDAFMQEHAAEAVYELGQVLVDCYMTPDSGVQIKTNTAFYESTPQPESLSTK